MHKTNTHRFFRYAFAFIDVRRAGVHGSGDLTHGERTDIEQLAGGSLAGGRRRRALRFVADNPIALRYLAALLRGSERW